MLLVESPMAYPLDSTYNHKSDPAYNGTILNPTIALRIKVRNPAIIPTNNPFFQFFILSNLKESYIYSFVFWTIDDTLSLIMSLILLNSSMLFP